MVVDFGFMYLTPLFFLHHLTCWHLCLWKAAKKFQKEGRKERERERKRETNIINKCVVARDNGREEWI